MVFNVQNKVDGNRFNFLDKQLKLLRFMVFLVVAKCFGFVAFFKAPHFVAACWRLASKPQQVPSDTAKDTPTTKEP